VQPYEDFLRPEDFTECFETMYFLWNEAIPYIARLMFEKDQNKH
jgi:hypothetical protein